MKKKKYLILSLIIIIFIMVITLNFETIAKYVTDTITSYYLRSKNFYYSSNLLSTANPTYQIGTWSGVGEFSISFDLFSKENEYLFSESDIAFTISVSCPQEVTCTPNKNSGTLYANNNNHSDNIVITVNPSRVFLENESVTVAVTASSSSPYVKELRATFTYIVGMTGVSYEIQDEDNRTYLFLKVTNDIDYCTVTTAFGNYRVGANISDSVYRTLSDADKAKCISQYITLSFNPQDLLLDNTSSVMDRATYNTTTINSINYINYLRFAISPNSTIAIKFYKIDPTEDYTYPIINNTSIITVNASNPT